MLSYERVPYSTCYAKTFPFQAMHKRTKVLIYQYKYTEFRSILSILPSLALWLQR